MPVLQAAGLLLLEEGAELDMRSGEAQAVRVTETRAIIRTGTGSAKGSETGKTAGAAPAVAAAAAGVGTSIGSIASTPVAEAAAVVGAGAMEVGAATRMTAGGITGTAVAASAAVAAGKKSIGGLRGKQTTALAAAIEGETRKPPTLAQGIGSVIIGTPVAADGTMTSVASGTMTAKTGVKAFGLPSAMRTGDLVQMMVAAVDAMATGTAMATEPADCPTEPTMLLITGLGWAVTGGSEISTLAIAGTALGLAQGRGTASAEA